MTAAYYSDETVTLYHGDCLEVTEWLQADVLVTDPPYGIAGNLSSSWRGRKPPTGHSRTHAKPQWDVTLAARDTALAAWGDRPYAVFGSPTRLDAAPPFREVPLVWDKDSVGMGDVSFPWGRSYELIYVNGAGWHGPRVKSVIRTSQLMSGTHGLVAKMGHPTPKPVDLMAALIARAPEGTVADPFAGSGSTLVAAKQLGRRAIGVEIEERYCEVIARRLVQGVLDFGDPA